MLRCNAPSVSEEFGRMSDDAIVAPQLTRLKGPRRERFDRVLNCGAISSLPGTSLDEKSNRGIRRGNLAPEPSKWTYGRGRAKISSNIDA